MPVIFCVCLFLRVCSFIPCFQLADSLRGEGFVGERSRARED